MKPVFFSKPSEFRNWLQKNHDKESELLVGFYKVGGSKPSMTWSESVDEALCFGWIDGVRKSMGEESYTIRFTPRKPGSNWSAINIDKVSVLKEKGLMQPAGMAAFQQRKESKSKIYSYENEASKLTPALERKLRAHKKAWKFFSSLTPGYKKLAIHRVMNAKQEKTQWSRLDKLIADCEAGIKP